MEKKFKFEEYDQYGLQTLEAISKADKFNKWMYETIKIFCDGKVLEIGSGTGNISYFFLENNTSIYLSDIRKAYRQNLISEFNVYESLKNVLKLDIVDPDFEKNHSRYLNYFDTVFALNVVEHIKDDELAISNCKKLLKKDGKLLILVPAYPKLYNKMDSQLQHYRRYTSKTLKHLFEINNLKVKRSFYINFAGIPGWYIWGKILKNEIISANQMNLYNLMVPLFKIVDLILFNKIGLSVIVVGSK